MKRLARLARLAVLFGFLAAAGLAQNKEGGEGENGSLQMWKWANFLVLAGALGYMIGKNAPPFFADRSRQIQKEMIEAGEERQAAEARAAAVERRLANLEAEIASLRSESQKDVEVEARRLGEHTAAEIAKIQAHAEYEIVAAGKAARMELKRHATELAIGLAEQKIRARMNQDEQDALLRGFVRDLK
jgi:F0F1-type ATP synthase membrane subunit b/b'